MQVPFRTSVKFPHSPQALALVAFGLGFGAAFGGDALTSWREAGCGVLLELLGGGEALLGLGFERGGAGVRRAARR